MRHCVRSIRPSLGLLVPNSRSRLSTTPRSGPAPTEAPNTRWLQDLRTRLGRCIQFGLKPEQVQLAGGILKEVNQDWRELVAGSEGFLTDEDHRGLFKQEVVWGEMDSMGNTRTSAQQNRKKKLNLFLGHVNNVTYNRYAESARINWAQKYATRLDPAHRDEWSKLWTSRGVGLILRSIRTDFKFPMRWPDRVSVYHKLRELPLESTDTFLLDVIILSERHRRVAARCVEDIVVYDYRKSTKVALQPFMVQSFQNTFQQQERTKRDHSARIDSLMKQVRQLEKDSWDRADAKEDFGSSGQTA
ncbi:MAG: hypothetical protein M1821_004227 [Bathelium mastoideum]|nr:MAG: hypothetical protein M1821_004227 [Bathelium mastoideum]KAI9685385.1 MAG: hypothetical protein M1822_004516 [Bathelium mastoideum]